MFSTFHDILKTLIEIILFLVLLFILQSTQPFKTIFSLYENYTIPCINALDFYFFPISSDSSRVDFSVGL
jgi:hypothetical protein